MAKAKAKATAKLVRLKPYNRKEGHLLQRLTVRSKRMSAGRWYKVTVAFAAQLAEMRQPRPPGMTSTAPTPLCFDITDTKAQAEAVEKASKPKPPVDATEDLSGGADLKTTDLTPAKEDKPSRRRHSSR